MSKTLQKVFSSFLILALALALVPLQFAGAAPSMFDNPATTVFINEIHYDNTGSDAGEAIEIAGPAGTDLTGWSIVLYNGSGGAAYGTTALSGTIPNQQGGYGTVVITYPSNGIQNGSPDGIALVDASSTLVQFLSYEGSFSGVGGPADGVTSTDIGVAEGSGTAIGDSLQLAGSGTTYGDFSWSSESANTFGTPNTGQTFSGSGSAPEIVINEIMQNPSIVSDNVGEWFELYNPGVSDIDIEGWTVQDNDIDSFVINNGGPLLIPAGGFLVLGNNASSGINGGVAVDYEYSGMFLSNGSDELVLLDSTLAEIDRVEWDNGATFPDPNGASMALSDPGLDNNDGANWCTSSAPFGAGDLGTPGAANDCGGSPSTDILINEVDADQASTDSAEFVELYDGGVGNTDLTGLVLVLFNGSNDTSYASFDLDSQSTNGDGYFVLCGDAANVPNCDLDVSPDTNLIQNGADAVALFVGDATDFPNGTSVTTTDLIDALVYDTDDGDDSGLLVLLNAGQPQVNERGGGDGTGHSNQRCPNGDGGARNTVSYAQFAPTPGEENICAVPVTIVKVHEVQGAGFASPLVGSTVIIEGIVVGDFQDDVGANGDLNGFFVQEEDADADADPATSEGVFVFQGSNPSVDVAIGDLVRVEGSVSEFFNDTQITSFNGVTVLSSGNPLPTASVLSLPVTAVSDFEAYEGMYVTFPQPLVISEYFNFDRFGEIVLTDDRQFQPTAVYDPGSPEAVALAAANELGRITLDDGRTSQNPDPAIHPNGSEFNLNNLFRGGDTVTNVTGVINYSFGQYRVQPTQGAIYTSVNPRTATPDPVGGNVSVASFNVLNYFTTLDDGSCPYSGGCRGADNATEFTRQRDKIIAAIAAIDADVVGLIEIENHPGDVPTADLVSGLNDVMGAGTYDYVATGALGTDSIRQAFIYKPATVSLVGDYAALDTPAFLDPNNLGDDKNRPALAQTFMNNTTGGVFTAVVNHLKSKGSLCGPGDDDPMAASCNLTRTLAAQELVNWLATDPTGSADEDFLIIGDLNSYDKEDPIDVLVAGGYTDLIFEYQGENAYSYVFDGQLGYLDYALANAGMLDEITGVTVWHNNTDEPDLIDYDTSFKKDAQDAIYAPDAYRSSDHDPVIVGLDVCDEIAPTFDELSVSPDSLWPANHKYVDVEATVVVSDNFDPNPTVELVSVESNEPDDGLGDGDTADDIVIVDDFHFMLRAERSGTGDGRVYTITYRVTDACGNSTTQSVTVTVPKSQGKNK